MRIETWARIKRTDAAHVVLRLQQRPVHRHRGLSAIMLSVSILFSSGLSQRFINKCVMEEKHFTITAQ